MKRLTAVLLPALAAAFLSTGVVAQKRLDFTGSWTRISVEGGTASAGSGWGPAFTIVQRSNTLVVERAFFSRPDLQPPLKFTYSLDGSESRNTVLMGRGIQEQVSRATWEGDKLVITTVHTDPGADGGRGVTSEVRQTLFFQRTRRQAHPPLLVIETTRSAVKNGLSSTTRTEYIRG